MIKENKITKIRLEYENGLIKELDDEENLKKWTDDLNSISVHAYTHGLKFRSLDWKIIQEGKDSKDE
jgi:hypothetical protein